MRWLPVGLLVSLAGCGQDTVDFWLEIPRVGMGETVVIIHGPPEARQASVTQQGAVGPPVVILADEGSGPDPVALLFAESAEDVNLPLGTTRVAPSDGGRRLFGDRTAFFADDPFEVRQLERRREPPSADWRLLSSIPSGLETVAIEFDGPTCPLFDQPLWGELVDPYADVFIEPVDDDHVVVVGQQLNTEDARWIASREGLMPAGTAGGVTAVVRVGDALWMGDKFGRLWTATPDADEGWVDQRPLGIPDVPEAVRAMATTGTTAALFVASGRQVLRYDGRRWRPYGVSVVRRRQMVALTPDRALLVDEAGRLVDAVEERLVEFPGAPRSLHSIQNAPGFGVVIGDDFGRFFRLSGDEWVAVQGESPGWFGLSAVAYEDGLLYLLASGVGGFFSETTRDCDDTFALRFITGGQVVAAGRDLFVAGAVANSQILEFQWVPRR